MKKFEKSLGLGAVGKQDKDMPAALPNLAATALEPQASKTLKSMVYLALAAYLGRPLASEDGAIR